MKYLRVVLALALLSSTAAVSTAFAECCDASKKGCKCYK